MKPTKLASVIQGFAHAGLPEPLIVPVGLIVVTSVIVHLAPSTSILGAILLPGL